MGLCAPRDLQNTPSEKYLSRCTSGCNFLSLIESPTEKLSLFDLIIPQEEFS